MVPCGASGPTVGRFPLPSETGESVSFTVVIPARNRAELIGRAVSSALRQTLAPDEVIVVDDASTDTTVEAAEQAGARVLTSGAAGGSGPARNRGVAAARSDWIAFLDSDDEWDPDHLQTLAGFTDHRVLVSSAARTTSGGGRGSAADEPADLTPVSVFQALNPLVTSGTAVQRSALERAGGFRALPRAQDFDCWLRVLEQGPGTTTGRRTAIYHEHDGQVSRHGDLNRRCVLQIIDDASARPWCSRRLRDDTLARFFFDDLRTGQRNQQTDRITKAAGGVLRRPAIWPAVVRLVGHRLSGTDRVDPES